MCSMLYKFHIVIVHVKYEHVNSYLYGLIYALIVDTQAHIIFLPVMVTQVCKSVIPVLVSLGQKDHDKFEAILYNIVTLRPV